MAYKRKSTSASDFSAVKRQQVCS